MEIAPGSILQRIYFKQRISARFPDGFTFCEIGSGNGWNTRELLSIGGRGVAYDLNEASCENNRELNKSALQDGRLQVFGSNFLETNGLSEFDVVFSCMVIEHLNPEEVDEYFEKVRLVLSDKGVIITLVPSSMRHWGVEDEIAGHFKRYEFGDFDQLAVKHKLRVSNIAGLTFPVSNILFGLSNRLINKSEGHKRSLDMLEQTKQSGNRQVLYKTTYPIYFRLVLNEVVLYPLHWLQMLFRKNPNSMVIYAECKPIGQ